MPAESPEQIHEQIAAAFNAGDVDAFVELQEETATHAVPPDGVLVNGKAEIRRAVEPIIALAPKFEFEVLGKLEGDELAVTHARWALKGVAPDGQAIEHAGRGTVVSRRQEDGRWLIVLDNPLSP